MLSQSVITQLSIHGYNQQRDETLYSVLWPTLSVTEKLQVISEAPNSLVFAIATRDDAEIVRYWAIRHAGQDRGLATHSDMRRLCSDTSVLVARRAAVWSYEDVVQGELPAVEAFVSGATWRELDKLPPIIENLVTHDAPDWPRIHAILRTFLSAPEVTKEFRGQGPHNDFLVDYAVSALEYLKSLMLRHPKILESTLGISLPIGFHHFSLLDGWHNFPPELLAAIVWSNKGSHTEKTVLEPLRQPDLKDPKLIALRDFLKEDENSREHAWNRWASDAPRQWDANR